MAEPRTRATATSNAREDPSVLRARLDSFLLQYPMKRRPGTTWNYLELGRAKDLPKECLLFLTPGTLRPEAFFDLLLSLSQSFHVIAPFVPLDFHTFDDYAAGLRLVLDYEGIRVCHVFGTGLGAMLGHYFVQQNPNLCLSFAAHNSLPPCAELGRLFKLWSRKDKIRDVGHAPAHVRRYLLGLGKGKTYRSMWASQISDTHDNEMQFWVGLLKLFGGGKGEALAHQSPRLEAAAAFHNDNLGWKPSNFADWSGPVLVLDGDRDEKVPGVDAVAEWKRLHPHTVFVNPPGTGHLWLLTRRRAVVSALLTFYQDHYYKRRLESVESGGSAIGGDSPAAHSAPARSLSTSAIPDAYDAVKPTAAPAAAAEPLPPASVSPPGSGSVPRHKKRPSHRHHKGSASPPVQS